MSPIRSPGDAGFAPLPGSLRRNPDLKRWLHFSKDGFVEICPGKVEIGQGILTALAQIAADELDVDLVRIRMLSPTTAHSPDEGVTSGSLSVQTCGIAVRHACAEVRKLFLAAAADRFAVPDAALSIQDGVFVGPENVRTSYWELAESVPLDREASGTVPPKPAEERRISGHATQRLDIPDKVFGRARFIHDLTLPGMLHGRVLRSPAERAGLTGLEEEAAHAVPGLVAIMRDGAFAGVVAETEEAAQAALLRLRSAATWSAAETLPDEMQVSDWLKNQPAESTIVDRRKSPSAVTVARTVRREYTRPFLAHASIAPSCALARWNDNGDAVHVWTHSQGIYNLRSDLQIVLSLPAESIVVEHAEGAGCYGHNGADDVALDAVLLARAVPGRPVRVQWTREDELARSPFGAAMAVAIEADLDGKGDVVGWRHEIWSNGHTLRPGRSQAPTLRAAADLEKPFAAPIAVNPPPAGGGGADRNAVPIYDFPSWQITCHRVLTMPLRTSALRSLGAFANVFAIESFLDELAIARGDDPLAFRLRHLRDARACSVLERAAARAKWGVGKKSEEGIGRGIGVARYKNSGAWCAIIADVACEEEVRVIRLAIAVDVGEAINPDGVMNQIEGGAIQATSWTLKEAVRFDRTRVTSDSWATYPILRFSEVPKVEVEIVSHPNAPPVGAGEAAQGPVAAAVGNAVFDALGVRIRDLPITRDRIIAAVEREDG